MSRTSKTARALMLSSLVQLMTLSVPKAADLLSSIRAHEITIGTANDAPLSFIDDKEQSAIGVFPDVLRAIFARMSVKVHIYPLAMPFSSLISALTSGRIDVIDDSIYATSARKQVIDLTNIVFYIRETLDVADYEGATYVNLLGEASADRPSGKSIDIRLFPTLDNVFADLSGGLDAATAASSLSAFALEQNPALNFEIVADYEAADRANAGSAIGVAKGNEAFQFNAAYSGMLADGLAAVTFTKWS
jgi:polar amino acid transport system substrate-binding protein